MPTTDAADIIRVYEGSNGEATKALYAKLEALGPQGVIAMNLFRACKCSERAKAYRGRGYRDEAYRRKQWSMDNLCEALTYFSESIAWGWGVDEKAKAEGSPHHHVLYVETAMQLRSGVVPAGRDDEPVNKAPIHVWRERIDGSTYAVIAIVEFVFRGGYHMATAWTMVPENDYRWRQAGDVVLREHILKEHGGHVPYLRRARDDGARTFHGERPSALGDQ